MERDDLDRFLSDDDIVPSSGFVARVMDAVRVDANAPPAIPFPWARALPGIAATMVTFVALIAGFFSMVNEAPASRVATSDSLPSDVTMTWLLVVLTLCTVPVVLSLRFTRGRS
jgi:hypothetical protein